MRLQVLVAVGAAAALAAAPARAATITVANTNDAGAGSLRQAVADANPGDTIAVPAGTITLTSGAISLAKAVTIAGAGARDTTISGNNADRIFTITTPAAAVTIQGVRLTAGKATDGGAISDVGVPLTLTGVALVGNAANATSGSGGGLDLSGATLTVQASLIAQNTAYAAGGIGITQSGTTSTISDSTIAQNTAVDTGGGVDVYNGLPNTVTFLNDTFVANTVTDPSSGQGGNFRTWTGATTKYQNTIFAQGSAAFGGNCFAAGGATNTSLGHNLEDANTSACNLSQTGDKHDQVLLLGALGDHGGPTDTFLPALTSPALDAGASCATTDQRGVARPQGAACDVGAVERTAGPTAATGDAGGIGATIATISGTVGGAGLNGIARFEYGTTTAYGATVDVPFAAGAAGVHADLISLAPLTTYHYRVTVITGDGTASGADQTFTTTAVPPAPVPGGGTPSPTPTTTAKPCVVPKLRGATLKTATRRLAHAGCRLGKVTRRKHGAVVVTQSAKAGTKHRAGYRVRVTLGPRPAGKRH